MVAVAAVTKPLWSKPIPIIGVTGPYGSGKTRFLCAIAPGPRTCLFDTEDSSESYEEIGMKRIDVPKEMLARHPGGYKPMDVFSWWFETVKSIPAGRFDFIGLDVAEDIETGLSDWVWENPLFFQHTRNQYMKMPAIYYNDVKAYWKQILVDVAARTTTFGFAVHQGSVWGSDNKPVPGKTKPKGKSTLMELASLFLELEKPTEPNTPPAAKVLKSRLSHNRVEGDTLITTAVLPLRLPVCTPEAIRGYLLAPVGGRTLRADECVQEVRLSDDERLQLRAQVATSEVEAERMRLERTHAEQQQPADVVPTTVAEPEPQTLQESMNEIAPPPTDTAAYVRPGNLGLLSSGGVQALFAELAHLLEIPIEQQEAVKQKIILEPLGVEKIGDATEEQLRPVEQKLVEKLRRMHAEKGTVSPF